MENFEMLRGLASVPLYCLAAATLSMFFTRLCIEMLPLFRMMDVPRGRHQHEKPVPRGGGLAIILSFSLVMLWYLIFNTPTGKSWYHHTLIVQFGPPLLAITILGLLDDRFELRSIVKLAVHIAIGCYLYWQGARIDSILGFSIPVYLALPLTVCWCIGIINAFNLIDGMDGLASGLAMISAFSMAAWQIIIQGEISSTVSLMVFCGACLGFLRYNFSPARIFLGDTGSMFIGLFFAYFSIIQSSKAVTITSLLVPVLAMGIPLFDVFLAIVRRLYRRYILKMPDVGIMTGDHDHLHHRLQGQLQNTRKTAYTIYKVAILLVVGAMAAAMVDNVMQSLSFAILLLVLSSVVRFATIEFYDAAKLFSEGIRIPRRKFILTALHPVLDVVLLTIAYVCICTLFQRDMETSPYTLKRMMFYIAPYPLVLILSGIYRTYWLRVGIARYYKLVMMLVIASFVVLALALGDLLLEFGKDRDQISLMREFFVAYALFGSALILMERFFLHYLESFGLQNIANSITEGQKKSLPRTLIYGGGLFCKLYLISLSSASKQQDKRKVIGILDDNSMLCRLNVYGLDVLGNIDELDFLLKKYKFNEIVIALRNTPEETRQKLRKFGKDHHIAIREFSCQVNVLEEEIQEE